MGRMIKLRFVGTDTVREITVEEAEQILEDTFSNRIGGLLLDGETGQVIWRIAPDTKEIVVAQMIGGG